MTYEHLTHGVTTAQKREIDRALLGSEVTPKDIGEANLEAMKQLGQIGAVKSRRKAT